MSYPTITILAWAETLRSSTFHVRDRRLDRRDHYCNAETKRSFDETIVAGKKAQRSEPLLSASLPLSRVRFAHLGREAEAREAAACLLEVDLAPSQYPRGRVGAKEIVTPGSTQVQTVVYHAGIVATKRNSFKAPC